MAWSPLDREAPYRYIRRAIERFKENHGKVIVEIGCMRMKFNHPIEVEPEDCPTRLDGHSTVHFAATGAEFYTVDINPDAVRLASEYTSGYKNTRVLCKDGIHFLHNFGKRIDLLFLDAWDVDLPDCAAKHLEAYNTAIKRMAKQSIILIDDCDVSYICGKLQPSAIPYGGKGELVVPKALTDGWKEELRGRCVLLWR